MKISFFDFNKMHSEIQGELEGAFSEVLKRNWFVLGSEVEKFEKNYANFSNTQYCVGVSNGLDALKLSLIVAGVKAGDEVIVPSNTYIATVLAVSFLDAIPVFVEPNIDTYNIDVSLIEAAITSKTKAIIPVHLYGQSCEMEPIMAIANKYELIVIEDNAQSHGAFYKGKITGSWGHLNATSFYPGKNLGALGDAGAITTNNLDYSKQIKTWRNYGSEIKYFNKVLGFNMRLDEIQAAFLSVKLNYIKLWNSQRVEIASWYYQLLADVELIKLPVIHENATSVFHQFIIKVEYRDQLQLFLKENGIETMIHYPIPPHMQEAYNFLNYKAGDFPIAENLSNSILSLPIWPGMNLIQVTYVANYIKQFYKIKNIG